MSDYSNDVKIPWATIGVVVVAFIVVGLGLDWLYAGQNFALYKFWAPKNEQVRREVYEQTKSYRKGAADRLSTLCGQVVTAGEDHKGLIYDQIKQEFSDTNTEDVPDYLQPCLRKARSQ